MFLPSFSSAFSALHLRAEGVFLLLKASTVAQLGEIRVKRSKWGPSELESMSAVAAD